MSEQSVSVSPVDVASSSSHDVAAVDLDNKFGVTPDCELVVVGKDITASDALTADEAISLAAWLVVAAEMAYSLGRRPQAARLDIESVLVAIKNT